MIHQPLADTKKQTQDNRANQQCDESRDDRLESVVKNLYHDQRQKRR